ncbi:amidase [Pseudonocardia sp. TRM90224]|uniref:amidase n=1 Tax=Pseudonocardia sp. TRM90224 TaxID=2812678 RepID=UPI001E58DFA4|nr:amidase [Pseudonocardia sp. TRM90224]
MRVHAFTDDALGDHDAVAVASLIRSRSVSAGEVARAAAERARRVDPVLGAIAFAAFENGPMGPSDAPLGGVPTFIKDNTDVFGMPTAVGSVAFQPKPAPHSGAVAEQILSTGVRVLGKSRMPEFGFNASTEFETGTPSRNPWDPEFSTGASSGGAAALVAAGVVPIAHANDGAGSIRIPAACCGLVGLKPSRGRVVPSEHGSKLPINLVTDGVVTRSVRDTAAYLAAAEQHWLNPTLPPLGLVRGPAYRPLRIGLLVESPTGVRTCQQTKATVLEVAATLESLGHHIEPAAVPIDTSFVEDFVDYWGMLAFLVAAGGKFVLDRGFDPARMDGLSKGLRDRYRHAILRTPGIVHRLGKVRQTYARLFDQHDLVLSPVLAHVTPRLGHLSPTVPFSELLPRLLNYVAFTPLNNVAGGPGISLPTGRSREGLPIGVHFSAAHGQERTLIEIGYALEQARPWRRIQDEPVERTVAS